MYDTLYIERNEEEKTSACAYQIKYYFLFGLLFILCFQGAGNRRKKKKTNDFCLNLLRLIGCHLQCGAKNKRRKI